jgi:hypothetical protein
MQKHSIKIYGELEVKLQEFITSTSCGISGQIHDPGDLPPGKKAGGWVGPRADLDAVVKKEFLSLPRTEPRSSSPQPVALVAELPRLTESAVNLPDGRPMLLQMGKEVMVLPEVEDEELPKLFPRGVEKVRMPSGIAYVRTTTDYDQASECWDGAII